MSPPGDVPVRLLKHPGPVAAQRWDSMACARSRAFRFSLIPGRSLYDGIVNAMTAAGVSAAALTLTGGVFARVEYCLAAPRVGRPQVAGYTDPESMSGPIGLIGASATLGLDVEGRLMVHCHALLADPDGQLFGGHVIPAASIVGAVPPVVFARAFEGAAIRQRYDAETVMSIFHPAQPGEGSMRTSSEGLHVS
ncbi:PPC domain-containing DNA-binding protein [Azorhizobium sp. AG788]|uniref:PPC domain-containing DNA-binding protein n=1 Tax=Azorhizobium sp. AG788 TaxID=2183897 RepID=UPI003139A8FC